MPEPTPTMIDAFIERWAASGAAERANYQLFLSELCDVLGVPRPDPQLADDTRNAYVFEKPVPLPHGTTGRIDLYKRGCFVLEAKQGSDRNPNPDREGGVGGAPVPRRRGTATRGTATWDTAMERAREQAQSYARNLPPAELSAAASGGRPPFLLVVDVGATLELYSEFTRTGGAYLAFPDPQHHRLTLEELRDADVRALLATVWSDPLTLDPARRSARVTRTIAAQLAALARSLEAQHAADDVAHFLMRCLFTMFAEDVGLLPNRSFTQLLADLRHDVASFPPMIEHLWRTMDTGGFSVILRTQIPRFNGELFADSRALPLDAGQLQLLSEAARADWRDVEPAIFGTLLERALDPVERHKLGAHYTPRAHVERLVQPTVVEPLRQEWDSVKTAALLLQEQGNTGLAVVVVEDFLRKLAHIRVLDPACGTANFLYVTMEHLKRLEAEVLQVRRELGQAQMTLEMESVQVTPQQFLGIELNPRAAAIAELVLWIGFLQWHFRTRGNVQPAEPIVRAFHNIECRDAVLAWDGVEPLLDADGAPVTRWDGRTFKRHPVTGEEVPDEQARVPLLRYLNPRPAPWPAADFVVGNPPFLGTARMREALGDGYTEALRKVYPAVPDSADYVMYWWEKAAELARTGALQRFGLITTNSLRQTFNRRVLERHLHAEPPLSLRFAIPDHPWVDTVDGAAVRIAMTVASTSSQDGVLLLIRSERGRDDESAELAFEVIKGQIQADLTAGAAVIDAAALKANQELSSPGMKLHGAGFIVTPEEAAALGYGTEPGLEAVIKPYRNGRDLTQTPRNMLVIDLFGLSEQDVRERYPAVYQRVYERVKPERDQNRRASYRERWWIHGEPRANFRPALVGLNRYIATVETMRHRVFVFLDHTILPDNKLIAMAFDDAYYLGVLSSRIHVAWSLAAGSHLGVGNDPVYVKTACFEKFPFPMASAAQQARIRASAERLDAHRKRQQERHPTLTLTDMYNVLERLRALDPNPDREGGEGVSGSGVVPSLTVGVQRGGATLAADTAEARTPNPDRKGGEPAGSIEGLPSLTVGVQRGGATLAADTAEARTPNPDRKGGEPGGSIEGLPSLTVGVQRGGATLAADTAEARTPNPDRKGGEPGGSIEGLPSLTVGVQRGGATLAADTAEARTPNPDRKGGEPAGSIEGLPSLTVGVQRGGATLAADTAEARTPNPDRKGGEPGGGIEGLPSLTVGVRIASTRTLAEPAAPYQPIPLAYLITFRTYGTWLPGDENGTVDDTHNEPGTHMLPPDPRRESQARDLMDQPAYTLDAPRRDIVLQTIQEVCAYRGWSLLAAHVRTNHVHVVVHASQAPEKVMTDFKAYASRKLNAAGLDEPERKRWSRHGSTRYLWQPEHAEAAIRYVVHEQGESMAVYENQERIVTYAPVTFEKALKEASGVYVAQSLLDLPEFQIEDIDAPNPDREGGEHAGGSGAFPSLTVGVRRELPSPFTVKERVIHEQGLVSILRQLHDELDAAVADAYGWPADLPDGEILQRLVDLNAQRAAEEVSGLIRWLRPAYQQARAGVAPVQATLVEEEGGAEVAAPALAQPLPWPASMPEQARAVRGVLQQAVAPLSPAEVAARFGKADKARVAELLETLASLGQAEEEKGRYSAL